MGTSAPRMGTSAPQMGRQRLELLPPFPPPRLTAQYHPPGREGKTILIPPLSFIFLPNTMPIMMLLITCMLTICQDTKKVR